MSACLDLHAAPIIDAASASNDTAPAGAPAPRLLAARTVGKRFGTRPAVADLDLDLHAGEVLGIVGESGSGKTTLLRMLSEIGRAHV